MDPVGQSHHHPTPEYHRDRENKNMVQAAGWLWGLPHPFCPSSLLLDRSTNRMPSWKSDRNGVLLTTSGPPNHIWPEILSSSRATTSWQHLRGHCHHGVCSGRVCTVESNPKFWGYSSALAWASRDLSTLEEMCSSHGLSPAGETWWQLGGNRLCLCNTIFKPSL